MANTRIEYSYRDEGNNKFATVVVLPGSLDDLAASGLDLDRLRPGRGGRPFDPNAVGLEPLTDLNPELSSDPTHYLWDLEDTDDAPGRPTSGFDGDVPFDGDPKRLPHVSTLALLLLAAKN